MKLTKKQIEIIRKNTPAELVGTYQTIVSELGYFQKYDANWAYHAGFTKTGVLVVTVYGKVI